MWAGAVEVANAAREHGLVIVAGAGVSMPAPTALPGWNDFNNLVLDGLGRRVSEATHNAVDGADVVGALKKMRDELGGYPPDFQAQLMEDECDTEDFRVLQVLDVAERNSCHEAMAALAATGHLRAIVTTNFDRLIEHTLSARGVAHETFYTDEQFQTLETRGVGPLPVIKVHGSVDSPKSMVDTLRQRMQGRPAMLQKWLAQLFASHASLTVGFSGADLAYEPEYLGLRAGVPTSPSFIVMKRAGDDLHPAMTELLELGPAARAIDDASLPDSLVDVARALGAAVTTIDAPGDPAAIRSGRMTELGQRVDAWVESVGHVTAVNLLAALVEGRSNRGAFEILRHTRREGLGVTTTATRGYWRFQVNFGRHLVERGINGNDIDANECYAALHAGQLDHIEPDDGFRMLLRAAYRGDCFDARAHLALAHLHRGECDRALEAADGFIQEAVSERYCLPILDAAISFGIVCSLTGQWTAMLNSLEGLYPYARRVGDEPRRARLSALLGRALAFKARDAEAQRMLAEAEKIGERLRLGLVLAEARAAIGSFEFGRGNLAAALPPLTWACKTFARAEQRATLLPALLDLVLLTAKSGDMKLCQEAISNIEAELDRFPGYLPRYYHRLGYAFVQTGQLDQAREALQQLRATGETTRNPWTVGVANRLEEMIAQPPI